MPKVNDLKKFYVTEFVMIQPVETTPSENVASTSQVQRERSQSERHHDLSNPRDLLSLDERLRIKREMVPQLTDRFCWCFSLAFGSYMVASITVGSSVVGASHMLEKLILSEWFDDEWMQTMREEVFDFMTCVALFLHLVLFFIGLLILYGLIREKFKIVQYASLALLFASVTRIMVAIGRLIVSQDFEAFLFFFVSSTFYLYGFVILWSYALDEEENQTLGILEDFETEEIVQRFGGRFS